jgi:hypothetical protein
MQTSDSSSSDEEEPIESADVWGERDGVETVTTRGSDDLSRKPSGTGGEGQWHQRRKRSTESGVDVLKEG